MRAPGTSLVGGYDPAALFSQLQQLVGEVDAWALDELEGSFSPAVRARVHRQTTEALDEAATLFGRVLRAATKPSRSANDSAKLVAMSDDPGVFLWQLDRTVETASSTAAADIAFIAKLEMNTLAREARSILDVDDGWRAIELCERTRRHIIKATTALRRTWGATPGISLGQDEVYVTELVRSLRVRRRYAIFHRRVAMAGAEHGDRPTARLRSVGTSIAVLICRPEYRDFRMGDRMLLRDLQRVIVRHLGAVDTSEHAADRIWQDTLGAVQILRQINRRPELLEHDNLVLDTLHEQLAGLQPGEDLAAIIEQADAVLGCDEAIDERLRDRSADVSAWRATVETARRRLEPHRAPTSAHREIRAAHDRAGTAQGEPARGANSRNY
ncbi:MAG: hypothetical protein K0V04_16450 [Deltaproteobacteria bacterium]|nr:hypothetical protein [Deltaproteobacteria bacterium]